MCPAERGPRCPSGAGAVRGCPGLSRLSGSLQGCLDLSGAVGLRPPLQCAHGPARGASCSCLGSASPARTSEEVPLIVPNKPTNYLPLYQMNLRELPGRLRVWWLVLPFHGGKYSSKLRSSSTFGAELLVRG